MPIELWMIRPSMIVVRRRTLLSIWRATRTVIVLFLCLTIPYKSQGKSGLRCAALTLMTCARKIFFSGKRKVALRSAMLHGKL